MQMHTTDMYEQEGPFSSFVATSGYSANPCYQNTDQGLFRKVHQGTAPSYSFLYFPQGIKPSVE